jgi:hypothetical protein
LNQTEIDALIGNEMFRFKQYDSVKHKNIRVFKSRIINEIKGKATDASYKKSRLIIQGYFDEGKVTVLTQNPTIQRSSQRVILAVAAALRKAGMQLWLRDITQAYTQSERPLQRTILAELPEQLRQLHPEGIIMVIIKPLYGIAKAGAY